MRGLFPFLATLFLVCGALYTNEAHANSTVTYFAQNMLSLLENDKIDEAAALMIPRAAKSLKTPRVRTGIRENHRILGKSIPGTMTLLSKAKTKVGMRYIFKVKCKNDVAQVFMLLNKDQKIAAFLIRSPKLIAHYRKKQKKQQKQKSPPTTRRAVRAAKPPAIRAIKLTRQGLMAIARKVLFHLERDEIEKIAPLLVPASAKALKRASVRAQIKMNFAITGRSVPGTLILTHRSPYRGMTRYIFNVTFKKDKGRAILFLDKYHRVVFFLIRTPKLREYYLKQAAIRRALKKDRPKRSPIKKHSNRK